MPQIAHAERAHAALGASSAHRWMACPGSIRLSEAAPPQGRSVHSDEGTAAHELAERALSTGLPASTWIGTALEGVEVTEDMAAHVQTYVDICRELQQAADRVWIEHKFSLGKLNPPGPMFGTNDFACYVAATKTLYIRDLKFGQGVVVEVVGNKQLRYYALGALLSPDMEGLPIDTIDIGIVQPRAYHPDGVCRTEPVPVMDLLEFTGELLQAAAATQDPAAPLAVGSHCRFCPAKAFCPEQKRVAEDTALIAFSDVQPTPPAPETLPQQVFEEILGKLDVLEDWIVALKQRAQRELEAGRPVKGFKLVQKRATRKWTDPDQVAQYLLAQGEDAETVYEPRTLKSVAQIEKLIGKKHLPTQYVIAESSGLAMVPESDRRPAVLPGQEFAAIPAATE